MNIKQNKEIIFYLIFGVLTTLVNIAVFAICVRFIGFNVVFANIIAWIVSVLFAYVTNRGLVFHSERKTFKGIITEIVSFLGGRLATGVLDTVMMFVFVTLLGCNDLATKIVVNILVIVLNYVISKFLVFNKKGG